MSNDLRDATTAADLDPENAASTAEPAWAAAVTVALTMAAVLAVSFVAVAAGLV